MFKIGLIGYGYWGPNLARNFNANPDMTLSAICDFSASRLEMAGRFELTRDILTILFRKTFPVDIRHNSKIFREKLSTWAAKKLL